MTDILDASQAQFSVIIPARYASTRFPAKPLALLRQRPMLHWVIERARLSGAQAVYVATDHQQIAQAATAVGAQAIMTRSDHPSGTDRVHEAVTQLALPPHSIVVNVQGDEPLIEPDTIRQVAHLLSAHSWAAVATLAEPPSSWAQLRSPNTVKVVCSQQGRALYFSRALLPCLRDAVPEQPLSQWRRHLGLYAYRRGVLDQFVTWPVATLEAIESLEQLRFLAQDQAIVVADAQYPGPAGVDTPEDLQRLEAWLAEQSETSAVAVVATTP